MELTKDYDSPYGIWKVTTEGDCEGRTSKLLGFYEGYIDEIALALADKCMYSLEFEHFELNKLKSYIPKSKSVSVTLSIKSRTWDLTSNDRKKYADILFKNRPVVITQGSYFGSFKINAVGQKTEKEIKEEALSKLTKEEKQALGLI